MSHFLIPDDVIFVAPSERPHDASSPVWIAINLFTRSAIALSTESVVLLREVAEYDVKTVDEPNAIYDIWEIGWFSHIAGMLEDPTRIRRNVADWPAVRKLSRNELTSLLIKFSIIVANEAEYRSRFRSKSGILDWTNFGNLHQQLGQQLIVKERTAPDKWWLQQKFEPGCRELNANLYRAVQQRNLEAYFGENIYEGDRVLDLGCGVGYYSNMLASRGASVLGIDPNEHYIEIARNNSKPGAEFAVEKLGFADSGQSITPGSFDVVFMSDALLFYFVSAKDDERYDLDALIALVKKALKPSGKFVSVEPHPVFYMQPWLGAVDRPFTAVTEYRYRSFGIVPTIRELVQSLTSRGFVITWMDELYPLEGRDYLDERAYNFASQFPLWILTEAMLISSM